MADLGKAAESVLEFAERFRAIIDLAEALKGNASIEQAIAERKAALAAATAEHEQMLADLDRTRASIAAAVAEGNDALKAHGVEMRRLEAATRDEAKATVENARESAAEIVAEAQQNADRRLAAAKKEVSAAAEELARARSELAGVESEISSARAELEEITAKMSELRRAAQSVLV